MRIQLRITIIYLTFLMISNTIEAQWSQVGQDIFNDSGSFQSVSINADATVLAIGIPQNKYSFLNGYVRIYRKTNDAWVQIGQDLVGEALGDAFGDYVSLNSDGSIVAIGATGNDGNYVGSGHVRVFQNINDVWTQLGSDIDGGKGSSMINGIQLGDRSGNVSLSADGFTLAIGATHSGTNGFNSGRVKVYEYSNNSWVLKGNTINGVAEGDLCGAVSLNGDGTIVAVGAWYNNGNFGSVLGGSQAGHVRIFEYNNTFWKQVGQAINGGLGELSGSNLSLTDDGSILAIGSSRSKRARVYRNINNVWTQIGEDIIQYSKDGDVQVSLSFDGSYLVAGTPRALSNQGSARLYKNNNDTWIQVNNQILGGQTADYFANTVDINADGSYIALGGIGKKPNGIDSDVVKVYRNDLQLGINKSSNLTVSVYPNPTINNLHLNFEEFGNYSLSIYDVSGKELFQEEDLEQKSILDFSKFTSGVYFLKIKEINTHKIVNVKIIKQ